MEKTEIEQRDRFMEELLCAVSQAVPCEYLSDLKLPTIRDAALQTLAELYQTGVPWPYCAYALSYITGDYGRFDTQDALLQYRKDISCGQPKEELSSERWKKVSGMIKYFNRRRGFGFILDEHGNDLFFHVSQIESYAGTTPKRGQKVLYGAVEESSKGRKAKHIFLKDG